MGNFSWKNICIRFCFINFHREWLQFKQGQENNNDNNKNLIVEIDHDQIVCFSSTNHLHK